MHYKFSTRFLYFLKDKHKYIYDFFPSFDTVLCVVPLLDISIEFLLE